MRTIRKGEWLEIAVPNDLVGSTIENFLKVRMQIPKKLLHLLRTQQSVTINHQLKPWHSKLSKGDKIAIQLFIKEDYGVAPQYGELHVLYEDDHLLIVNKPEGIETHPNEKEQQGTLSNLVAYHYLMNGTECKVRHVHRLDKGTSGAIIFAKHPLASALLDRMLEKREIKRTYFAIVHGMIHQKKGIIHEPIGRDRHHPTRRRVSQGGQSAITHYKVVDVNEKHKLTYILLQLQTGRTHQIRVHMSHIGYPLVGDVLYGGKAQFANRLALHAANISFVHPLLNEEINCFAPCLELSSLYPKMENLRDIIYKTHI